MIELSDNIFREYDIRGVFGTDLTEETAELIGRGYAAFIEKTASSSGNGGRQQRIGRRDDAATVIAVSRIQVHGEQARGVGVGVEQVDKILAR